MDSFTAILLDTATAVTAEDGSASGWDIGTLLGNATSTIRGWGGLFVTLLGVIMIIVAAYQIGKGFITHGKAQTNWVIAILCLVVGGAFLAGGWNLISGIAKGGSKTIEDLGKGTTGTGNTILPMLSMLPFLR